MFINVHDMALLNDDALETGEMYTRLRASEASEPNFYVCISALKTYDSSQISIYIYIVDKSLFVGFINNVYIY